MNVGIAGKHEIPQMVSLLEILFSQEEEFSPNSARQEAGLRQIMDQPEIGTILVLRAEGRVLGMVNILFTISTFLGCRVALLEDMIIHPDLRGQGAGTKLLAAAVEHAQKQGCQRITLLTDSRNQSAIAFYGKQGFIRSSMVPLRKMLIQAEKG